MPSDRLRTSTTLCRVWQSRPHRSCSCRMRTARDQELLGAAHSPTKGFRAKGKCTVQPEKAGEDRRYTEAVPHNQKFCIVDSEGGYGLGTLDFQLWGVGVRRRPWWGPIGVAGRGASVEPCNTGCGSGAQLTRTDQSLPILAPKAAKNVFFRIKNGKKKIFPLNPRQPMNFQDPLIALMPKIPLSLVL